MKKKILMIGNTDGLPGVPLDIDTYYNFFTSPIGGNWCHEEIDILLDTDRRCLFRKINEIERTRYDYLITFYSGHGNEASDGTSLHINEYETIAMRELLGLSPRHLLILHCCRNYALVPDDIRPGPSMLSMRRDPVRKAYEDQIWYSAPQEVILFACDEGELAWGTCAGGYYLQHLLFVAKMALADYLFVSVSHAHRKAVSLMKTDPHLRQHPQIRQTPCLPKRRLPLAVNSSYWTDYDH